jgi:ribonuclease P protein component
MRFRREQHLRRQSDFRAVRELGRRIDCGAFTLWHLSRTAPDTGEVTPASIHPSDAKPAAIRLGVVASTAAVGPAVQRNRAKRRLRAIFRENQGLVPAGTDLLLVARAAVNRWENRELTEKFIGACRRLPAAKES